MPEFGYLGGKRYSRCWYNSCRPTPCWGRIREVILGNNLGVIEACEGHEPEARGGAYLWEKEAMARKKLVNLDGRGKFVAGAGLDDMPILDKAGCTITRCASKVSGKVLLPPLPDLRPGSACIVDNESDVPVIVLYKFMGSLYDCALLEPGETRAFRFAEAGRWEATPLNFGGEAQARFFTMSMLPLQPSGFSMAFGTPGDTIFTDTPTLTGETNRIVGTTNGNQPGNGYASVKLPDSPVGARMTVINDIVPTRVLAVHFRIDPGNEKYTRQIVSPGFSLVAYVNEQRRWVMTSLQETPGGFGGRRPVSFSNWPPTEPIKPRPQSLPVVTGVKLVRVKDLLGSPILTDKINVIDRVPAGYRGIFRLPRYWSLDEPLTVVNRTDQMVSVAPFDDSQEIAGYARPILLPSQQEFVLTRRILGWELTTIDSDSNYRPGAIPDRPAAPVAPVAPTQEKRRRIVLDE